MLTFTQLSNHLPTIGFPTASRFLLDNDRLTPEAPGAPSTSAAAGKVRWKNGRPKVFYMVYIYIYIYTIYIYIYTMGNYQMIYHKMDSAKQNKWIYQYG